MSSGVASARKSSTPASLAMLCAVSAVSPVIITVRMPIAPKVGEPLRDARFDDVLEMHDAEHPVGFGDQQRGATVAGDLVRGRQRFRRHRPPLSATHCATWETAPLRIDRWSGRP